jgi:hypothetical protein
VKLWVVAAAAAAVLVVAGPVAGGASLTGHHPAAASGSTSASPSTPQAPGDAWKHLGPREKARTMKKLTREHARGMRAWARCKATGRDNCVRPLPPGLAKKR